MSDTPLSNLKEAIKARLYQTGDWTRLKAKVSSQVCYFLDNEGLPKNISCQDSKAQKLNEFFIKYLKNRGYESTLEVFLLESGSKQNYKGQTDNFEAAVDEIMKS